MAPQAEQNDNREKCQRNEKKTERGTVQTAASDAETFAYLASFAVALFLACQPDWRGPSEYCTLMETALHDSALFVYPRDLRPAGARVVLVTLLFVE